MQSFNFLKQRTKQVKSTAFDAIKTMLICIFIPKELFSRKLFLLVKLFTNLFFEVLKRLHNVVRQKHPELIRSLKPTGTKENV